MKTTKPISTISYNSLPFLIHKLDDLVKTEILSFWCVIEHQAEEDEKKDHCHVYMEPAKPVETTWLKKQFIELDNEHPETPLGVLPINKSKFVDWYWYGLHDKAYLASKNQSRKHHYDPSQMLTSDPECLAEYVRQNPNPKAELLKVMEMIMQGYSALQIAIQMNVPTRNLAYFMQGIQTLFEHRLEVTDRNGQPSHELVYDPKGKEEDDKD